MFVGPPCRSSGSATTTAGAHSELKKSCEDDIPKCREVDVSLGNATIWHLDSDSHLSGCAGQINLKLCLYTIFGGRDGLDG